MDTVLWPDTMVVVPGREPMPLFPPARRPVAAPRVPPALHQPPPASQPTVASERWRIRFEEPTVQVPGRAAPMPLSGAPVPAPTPPVLYATNFATSVALVPAGGTNVTSTPANLMIGPITYIRDFTINTLDAGTY